jgi:hypothetical protein
MFVYYESKKRRLHPEVMEIGGGERGDVYNTRVIRKGVFDFSVDIIGFTEVKGDEKTDGKLLSLFQLEVEF